MSRQATGTEQVRKIGRTGTSSTPSYFITLPIELVRKFGWKEGQRVVVRQAGSQFKLIVEDFE